MFLLKGHGTVADSPAGSKPMTSEEEAVVTSSNRRRDLVLTSLRRQAAVASRRPKAPSLMIVNWDSNGSWLSRDPASAIRIFGRRSYRTYAPPMVVMAAKNQTPRGRQNPFGTDCRRACGCPSVTMDSNFSISILLRCRLALVFSRASLAPSARFSACVEILGKKSLMLSPYSILTGDAAKCRRLQFNATFRHYPPSAFWRVVSWCDHRSWGFKPVCLAIRASIFGPISSSSPKHQVYSGHPWRTSFRWEEPFPP